MKNRYGVIGVIRREDRVLMVRRAEGVAKGGTWCFPGGHIEPGETPEQALKREMREELGIDIPSARHLGVIEVPGGYRLEVFIAGCPVARLDPEPAEIADVRWVSLQAITELEPGLPSNATVQTMLTKAPSR